MSMWGLEVPPLIYKHNKILEYLHFQGFFL